PSSSPCIEFNSVSPTDLKMGLMESNFLKMLRGLMKGLIIGGIKGLMKGRIIEGIIKSKGFLNRFW
ncbi:hypothetical protein, partial [Helicobacter pylori]|uniref:hypothetical protein n=1 Tax=Helicobacter pylori TaxID=210 RepID=UPI001C632A52